ncbi:MAG: hypothetical protein E5X53_17235 [Mesorhizobium sp.]|uniref:hypothetical protein n=1 Tax=Mesorhizobium sp. TaxID=1871066 RepID=UPI0011F457ED|nr:hypothetical protein [Mesorhizobium sp.]TIP73339.1 MAG: hypothetical protein E5X55_14560 [Mesorhizobium sp.]TIQ11328.1 MAG: hypothetical protein E5X57_18280 [Mesorhizobium sp.]TIR50908.1 MAG: hypothetical protein E5X53_17235 [Mesorhizobium sp.]TJV93354.1 MAG: hypothetical protein E5X52_31975 [Mesorhizobium sp.]
MIGKAFIDPETERIYHVTGVMPAHEDLIGGNGREAALVIIQDGLEARLVTALEADRMEGLLASCFPVLIRSGVFRYAAGTPFVLYRVADWKSGKVWGTPLREFHKQFQPIEGGFIESVSE